MISRRAKAMRTPMVLMFQAMIATKSTLHLRSLQRNLAFPVSAKLRARMLRSRMETLRPRSHVHASQTPEAIQKAARNRRPRWRRAARQRPTSWMRPSRLRKLETLIAPWSKVSPWRMIRLPSEVIPATIMLRSSLMLAAPLQWR